jgi:hypothetical protein
MFTDWVVTMTGILTLINPLLYSYYGITLATWNNLIVGAAVLLLAVYQDLKDSGLEARDHGHYQAH